MAPKPEKSESGSISCKHGTEGLYGKNNWSVPTFLRSGPIFFCSVNGAIASALWPFLEIFKMLSFFEYYLFFGAVFCIEFREFYFLTQTEYFAWAIAFALWPILAIFKKLSFFEY